MSKTEKSLKKDNTFSKSISTESPHELKALQSQLSKAKMEAKIIADEAAEANRRRVLAEKRVHDLTSKLTEIESIRQEPIVSEHAMLRWLERVKGINLQEITAEILTEKNKKAINFSKSGRYIISELGVALIFKNCTVITVELI